MLIYFFFAYKLKSTKSSVHDWHEHTHAHCRQTMKFRAHKIKWFNSITCVCLTVLGKNATGGWYGQQEQHIALPVGPLPGCGGGMAGGRLHGRRGARRRQDLQLSPHRSFISLSLLSGITECVISYHVKKLMVHRRSKQWGKHLLKLFATEQFFITLLII